MAMVGSTHRFTHAQHQKQSVNRYSNGIVHANACVYATQLRKKKNRAQSRRYIRSVHFDPAVASVWNRFVKTSIIRLRCVINLSSIKKDYQISVESLDERTKC